ncbi:serpin-ZX-like [Pyrus ussuriensis x Pyrus communis]|uniref:Serpin-ZX-like n=1 Tax=Pyrus ussuriensis x Pyrus communis TaxID=2448454 RepID=A0A5N5HJK7_9ROSA|nr:serpin-ZX-like [Pyrus ussuriensis x Pyrus communis]
MDLRESVINQNDFALGLTKQLLQTEGKQSTLVYSPLSIHVLLSLIAAGSKGPTQDQLLSFLKSKSTDHLNSFAAELVSMIFSDGSPSGGPHLSFACGVWVDRCLPLKPSFKQVVDTSYMAALAQVDFQTNAAQVASGVNSWAEKETRGLIKEVLPPGSVDSSTRLIFANALYFKGAWTEKFDASQTKEHDFHLLDGSTVQVPFMTSRKKQYNLYVSSIFHKSFIEVNEEGTEAAAATAGVIKFLCLEVPRTVDFVADRPFLFLIKEELTGTVLFIGHVLNPLAG